ncbi:MAG: 50S ribosomal protein L30 [Actinobacteria bacterium]|nr:50S ribosomal protein L30 [Actinomycetota bacterium]
MSSHIRITQVRSPIGAKDAQRRTLRALGLRRVRHTVSQPDRPEIRGMIARVAHLVDVRHPGGRDRGEEPT